MKVCWYSLLWIVLVLAGVQSQECPYDAPPEQSNGCVEDANLPQELTMGPAVDILNSADYPYIVSLQTLESGNHALGTGCYKHFCGGTMIAPNLILSAAHCFDDYKISQEKLDGQQYYLSKVTIYAAISPQCRHLSNKKYGRMKVNQIFIYPEYVDGVVPINDVAVLQVLGQEGKYYEGPLVQLVDKTAADAKEALVLGYGEAQPAHVGQYIVYPIHGANLSWINEETCKGLLDLEDEVSSSQIDYTNMVCYLNQKADPCNGDSGGPLLDNSNGVQVALVSWGTGGQCLDFDRLQPPGIFVRLTLFVDWIQQIIQEFGVASTLINTVAPSPKPPPPSIPSPKPTPTPSPTPKPTPAPTSIAELEANALLSFKNNMNDASQLSSWEGINACTDWEGILCQNDRVIEITLGDSFWNISEFESTSALVDNVQTSIPVEWSIIDKLQKLQLGNIGLTGFLPVELSVIKTLEILNVEHGRIRGTLPMQYSTLVSLVAMDIGDYGFTGPHSPEVQNMLQGAGNYIQSRINANDLTGTLPPQYSHLTSLEYLYLNKNSLSGVVPPEYSKFQSSADIYLFPQDGDSLCLDKEYESIVDDDDIVYC